MSKYTLAELNKLWEKFGDVPVDNNDNIEEKFLDFDIGTDKIEIWSWFEEQHPDFSVGKRINGK